MESSTSRAPGFDAPPVGIIRTEMHHSAHVMAGEIGVIGDFEPELRDFTSVLDANSLRQRLANLGAIGARHPRDDEPAQAQATPNERHYEQCAEDKKDLLEYVPLVQLSQDENDEDENEKLDPVHGVEPIPRHPRV
jgi:hypothetical protein